MLAIVTENGVVTGGLDKGGVSEGSGSGQRNEDGVVSAVVLQTADVGLILGKLTRVGILTQKV